MTKLVISVPIPNHPHTFGAKRTSEDARAYIESIEKNAAQKAKGRQAPPLAS